MSSIHDLLDAVSSGQPSNRLSVDVLVRAGHRRQRAAAAAVAAGTAAVVATAAAVAGLGVGGSSKGTAAGTSPTLTAPLPIAPTASAQPIIAGPYGALVPITTVHLLQGGRRLQITLRTDRCNGRATLTAVESAQAVTLKLALAPVPTAPLPEAAQPSGGPPVNNSCTARPTAVVTTGTSLSIGDGDLRTTLSAPLGSRRLVDAATGATIPYTSEAGVRKPTWLPPGISAFGPVQPVASQGWIQRFEPDELSGRQGETPSLQSYELVLSQTDNAPSDIGGPANATVGSVQARVDQRRTTVSVTWWASGELFTLTANSVSVVCPTANAPRTSCHLQSAPPTLATDLLLKTASSVSSNP